MTTSATRRARLRSMTTREPFVSARGALMLGGRSDPVLPEATYHQQEWEGLLFGALRVLHFPEVPRYKRLPGSLRSLRVIPGAEGLCVDVASAGAALTIAERLIPGLHDGEWSGVPGLRLQALDGAAMLYRLGAPGSVTFAGVTVDEIRTMFQHQVVVGASSPTWDSPRGLTLAEQSAPEMWSPSELRMISCVVRRVGLLIGMGGYSIDLWWSAPERISVETFVSHLTPLRRMEMLSAMTSSELTPRLVPSMRSDDNDCHTHFEFEDRSCELYLRIQVTGRANVRA